MKNSRRLYRRGLALALSLALCVGMLQLPAFAAEDADNTSAPQTTEAEVKSEDPIEDQKSVEDPAESTKEGQKPTEDPAESTKEDQEPNTDPDEPTKEGQESNTDPDEPTKEGQEPNTDPDEPTKEGQEPNTDPTEPTKEDQKPAEPSKDQKPAEPTKEDQKPAEEQDPDKTPSDDTDASPKCPTCGGDLIEKGGKYVCIPCNAYIDPIVPEKPSKPEHVHSYDKVTDRCECEALNPNHTHSYNEGGKCSCGEQHTHSWTYKMSYSVEFQHVARCSGCGAEYTEACTARPVYEEGIQKVKCTRCGYWAFAKDVHSWAEKWVPNENGYHTLTCNDSDCTATRTEECKLEAFDEGVRCSVCGWVKYNDGVGGGSKECPDGKHDYGNVAQASGDYSHIWTCVTCGYTKTDKCEMSIHSENGQPVAHYCKVCGNQKFIAAFDPNKPYCIDLGKGHDWYPKLEVLSEDGKSVLTTLECKACGFIQITDICNSPSQVVVHYVYEGGKMAAPDRFQTVIAGMEYSIPSPEIEGYTPDYTVISDKCTDGKGAEHTVTYTANPAKHTLTVKFEDETGKEILGQVTEEHAKGDKYSVTVKELTGYKPECDVVTGIMPADDELRTVKYSPITYYWTIYYLDSDGNKLVAPFDMGFTVNDLKGLDDQTPPDLSHLGYKTDVTKVEKPTKLADQADEVKYELITYQWTIQYVDEEGNEMAPPYEQEFTAKTIKTLEAVKSPDAEGFVPDMSVVIAPDSLANKTVKVTYYPAEKKLYTLTVKFENANGEEIFPAVVQKLPADKEFTVSAHTPNLGYAPELEFVTGTMPEGDELRTIKYFPINYTWTIQYVDEEGNTLREQTVIPYTVETVKGLDAGAFPVIDGYERITAAIAGPDAQILGNVTSRVVYRAATNEPSNPPSDPSTPSTPSTPSNPGGPSTPSDPSEPSTPNNPTPDPVENTDVPEDDVPLVDNPADEVIPTEEVPLVETPVEEILPEEVPLSEVPKTGDGSGIWSAMALLSACGLAVLNLLKKREK